MKKCVNCLNNDQHKTHTHTYTSAVYTDINTYIYMYMHVRTWCSDVGAIWFMDTRICKTSSVRI